MEKTVYFIIFVSVWLITLLYMVKAKKRKESIASHLFLVLLWSLAAITSYLVLLLVNHYYVISVCYSIFFMCMDWLLFYLLLFTWEYTDGERGGENRAKTAIKVILGLDTASMLGNAVFEHAMGYETVTYGSDLYLIFVEKPLYNVHLIICYVICALIFGSLIVKALQSPAIYKQKYLVPFYMLLLVVVLNAVFLLFRLNVDISIAFYPLAAILIYYNVFDFQPRYLILRTMIASVSSIPDGVFLFDLNGKEIWQNEKGNALFGELQSREELCQRLHLKEAELKEGIGKEMISLQSKGEGRQYFDLQFHEILDEKKRFLGCFFMLHDVTKEIEYSQKQEYYANYDQFTGIYNKRTFYSKVEERILTDKEPYIIMITDVGNFKLINDMFGTETGDKIILRIAQQIQKNAPQGAVYGRFENDTFAEYVKKSDFSEETFYKNSEEILNLNGAPLPVKRYVGIYEIEDKSVPVDIMCDRAIMALNTVKKDYHNIIARYDGKYREALKREQEIISGFQKSLDGHEFKIYLQAQINHTTGENVGAEALVRWIHPQKGMISPAEFIPILEEKGMIIKLDVYVWEEVCKILKRWKDAGLMGRSISVNISPKDLYLTDIYAVFTGLMEKYQLNPSDLKLEITESSLITDVTRQVALIKRLQEIGFKVEMDDFGSGYSSLNTLKDIPVDILKMDMKFFDKTENSGRSEDILTTIVELAGRLKVPVIAEGVEEKEQADQLSQLGCHIIQGYLYAKPMPLEEYEAFISSYQYKDLMVENQ